MKKALTFVQYNQQHRPMNIATRTRLKKLFQQQDQYDKLTAIAQHARVGQPLFLRTSKNNQILLADVELSKLIESYALSKVSGIEDQLKKEKV